jgi:hypothetical protein
MDVIFPTYLGVLVMKLLQEVQVEPNDIHMRINQTIQLQQSREEVYNQTQVIQENIKNIYDKRTKVDEFQIGDKALKWDSRNEEKGNHGKIENLWKGPLTIHAYRGGNAFFIKDMDGADLPGGLVNGRMLKHYVSQE